jgi:GH35 family endo-1,4-beta-xylanase
MRENTVPRGADPCEPEKQAVEPSLQEWLRPDLRTDSDVDVLVEKDVFPRRLRSGIAAIAFALPVLFAGCSAPGPGGVIAETPTPITTPANKSTPSVAPTTVLTEVPTITIIPPTATTRPTEAPTKTVIPPTATPKPTETPTPVLPLEKQPATIAAVTEFANAMRAAGVATTPEQILQKGLATKDVVGKDGKKYQIASTQDGYPLMMRTEGGAWETITPGKAAQKTGVEMGALLTGYWVLDPEYKGAKFMSLLGSNFNGQASADINWVNGAGHDLHASKDKYDFAVSDAVIRHAQKNSLAVNFQSMFWGDPTIYPKWFMVINNKEEFLKVSGDFVDTLTTRYKGQVNSYVLINELFGWMGYEEQQGNLLQQQLQRLGINKVDFIVQMSDIIFKNDSQAHILVNDFGIEIPGTSTYYKKRSDLYMQLLKDLKDKNSHVDTIGLQFHLNAADFSNEQQARNYYTALGERLKLFQEMGYRIQATELDVRLNELSGLPLQQRLKIQGEIYYNIIYTLLKNKVTNIDVWGIIDGDSFLEKANWLKNPESSDPLLFNDSLAPKMSYYSIIKAIIDANTN